VGRVGRLFAISAVLLLGCSERPATRSWTPAEIQVLRSLSLESLPAPPPSASNRVADDERAARMGQRLFFDPALSANGEIACVSCHVPALHFSDGRPTSQGMGTTSRNTPSIVGAAYSPFLFWDGRRDSLWAQALAPLETEAEMGSDRLSVVRVATTAPRYAGDYRALFGEPPDFADPEGFPERASPFGSDAARAGWSQLDDEARRQVNRAFSNVGKAIAAYERSLLPGPSPFDRYVSFLGAGAEDQAAAVLSPDAIGGLRLFIDAGRTQCLRCHNGPLLTNQAFHDVGSSRLGRLPDLGRFIGLESLLRDDFNCLGPYSDAEEADCGELRFLSRRETVLASGAFKTPGLREVGRTAPYFHDGSLADLAAVIEHYRNPPADPGSELTPIELSDDEAAQLASFLRALSGGVSTESE
jgi:cytochrome c peroxidase